MEEENSRRHAPLAALQPCHLLLHLGTVNLDAYVYFGSNLFTAPAVMGMQAQHAPADCCRDFNVFSQKGAFNFDANQTVVLNYLTKGKGGPAKNI
jgi:hypothetical protein